MQVSRDMLLDACFVFPYLQGMTHLIGHARDFAAWAHATQTYGDGPYLLHLEETAKIAATLADDTVDAGFLQVVAYLHDVIEETPVTRLFLHETFGDPVAKAVALLTDPPTGTRREKKRVLHSTLADLSATEPSERCALLVKLADRVANVRACMRSQDEKRLRMYAREFVDFRAATRREGLGDVLWDELEKSLTRSTAARAIDDAPIFPAS